MLNYTVQRLPFAILTLILIIVVIFFRVDLAPSSPAFEIPLTAPPEVRAKVLDAIEVNGPFPMSYACWVRPFFHIEPLYGIDEIFSTDWAQNAPGLIAYSTKVPMLDYIGQRLPQTLAIGLAECCKRLNEPLKRLTDIYMSLPLLPLLLVLTSYYGDWVKAHQSVATGCFILIIVGIRLASRCPCCQGSKQATADTALWIRTFEDGGAGTVSRGQ